jgi:hypothetical protein
MLTFLLLHAFAFQPPATPPFTLAPLCGEPIVSMCCTSTPIATPCMCVGVLQPGGGYTFGCYYVTTSNEPLPAVISCYPGAFSYIPSDGSLLSMESSICYDLILCNSSGGSCSGPVPPIGDPWPPDDCGTTYISNNALVYVALPYECDGGGPPQ